MLYLKQVNIEDVEKEYEFIKNTPKDENGFTILEGGMSTPGARREHYYTWSEYCRTWSGPNYHYIKYIVYPNSIHLVDIDPVKEEALLTHI